MDDTELKGRRIRVAYANSGSYSTSRRERPEQTRENGPVSRNLFVANIPPNVRLRELEEFFERYGKGVHLLFIHWRSVLFMHCWYFGHGTKLACACMLSLYML